MSYHIIIYFRIIYILQCQFTVGTLGTVTIPMDVIMKIDYLRTVVRFHDDTKYCFKLQGVEWGRSIAPLKEVIKFTEDEDAYVPPSDEKMFFETFCLAHYMAYSEMTSCLCETNCSPLELSRVHNSSKEIKRLIRNKLRTIAQLEKVKNGKCAICDQWVSNSPLPTSTTPCCDKMVHEACWNDPYECLCCHEPVNFLHCVECDELIEYLRPPLEGYGFYSSRQLKCCGVDIHQLP